MSKTISAKEAVPKIFEVYTTSLIAMDPDAWISNWTEDCVQLPPGGPMVNGKQNLYASIGAWLEMQSEKYTVSEFKIFVEPGIQEVGDWAFAHGNYFYRLEPKGDGEPYYYEGKFLSIFKRQPDGAWKLHRDCFNASRPDQKPLG